MDDEYWQIFYYVSVGKKTPSYQNSMSRISKVKCDTMNRDKASFIRLVGRVVQKDVVELKRWQSKQYLPWKFFQEVPNFEL